MVVLPELPELLQLVLVHLVLFFAPTVVRLFGAFDLLNGFLEDRTFSSESHDLAELLEDLVGRVAGLLQGRRLVVGPATKIRPESTNGGRGPPETIQTLYTI